MRILPLALLLLSSLLPSTASAQWERIDTNYGIGGTYTTNLATFDGTFLYATVLYSPPVLHLFRSGDHGTTWTEQTGFPNGVTGSANFFTVLEGRLAMGGLAGSSALFLFSDDQGATWDQVLASGVGNPKAMARQGDLHIVATANVFARSTDDGQTWANVAGSPTAGGAVVITANRVIAIAQFGFLQESSDEGLTWSALTIDGASIATALWEEGSTTYVKMSAGSLYASTDGGVSWNEQPTFDPLGFTFVTPGPALDNALTLSSVGAPLVSTDQGATATDLTAGYPLDINGNPCTSNFAMTDVYVIANAWACFNGSTGVYRQMYASGTAVGESPDQASLQMEAPWPNPAGGDVFVRFTTKFPGAVTLSLLDLLGREMLVLDRSTRAQGTHTVSFNVGRLPAGSYRLRLSTESGVAARMLSIVR